MLAAIILAAVIDICFILDTFLFVPKGVDKFSRQHILDGDKTGALTKALKMSCTKIKKGQVWRLVTQVFLHVGLAHIVFNTAALLIVGCALGSTLGSGRMLACFFFSAFCSACIMAFVFKFDDGEGASTGIYGMIATYLLMALKERDLFFSPVPAVLIVLLLIYAVIGMLTNPIDRREHADGFLGGIIFGIVFVYLI